MNFKDCYKKANDEIKGDRELLEKILNTPVKKKTEIKPFVYRFASLAAAIVLVGAVILMPEIKDKFVEETAEAPGINMASFEEEEVVLTEDTSEEIKTKARKEASDNKEEISVAEENSAVNEKTTDETVAGGNTETYFIEESEEAASSSEDEIEKPAEEGSVFTIRKADDALYDDGDIAKPDGAVADASVANEQAEPATLSIADEELTKVGKASGGGSSARNAAMSNEDYSDVNEYDALEILNIIGINHETLKAEGMTLNFSEEAYAEFSEDGEIIAYDISFSLDGNGGHMTVLITDSVTPLAYDITEANGTITASKTLGNSDIFVTAYNMTKENVGTYLDSIA